MKQLDKLTIDRFGYPPIIEARRRRRKRKKGGGGAGFTLTAAGTGLDTSDFKLVTTADVIAIVDGDAWFWDDDAHTLGQSKTKTFTTGTNTFYITLATGTANLIITNQNAVTQIGDAGNGWATTANSPSLGGDINQLTSLTYLRITGSNTISGSIAALTSLTYLHVTGSNTISGSVTALTSLTLLYVLGSNTISGSVTALTSLTYIRIEGSNTISGSIAALTSLTNLWVEGSNTISGSIAALTSLTYLRILGLNTVSGDLGSSQVPEGLNSNFHLDPCGMILYTGGITFWENVIVIINPAIGYGYDATEIDNILIDMSAPLNMNGKTITLMGSSAARTAASDAAVAILVGAGCTINTNP